MHIPQCDVMFDSTTLHMYVMTSFQDISVISKIQSENEFPTSLLLSLVAFFQDFYIQRERDSEYEREGGGAM